MASVDALDLAQRIIPMETMPKMVYWSAQVVHQASSDDHHMEVRNNLNRQHQS